jgi:TRAP-type C4-dicarboxylate transport system permease small subunit
MRIENKIEKLCRYCDFIAWLGLFSMMAVFVAETICRRFWKPLPGAYDIVGLLQVVLVAFAIPYFAFRKGHIQVELIVQRFPKRVQQAVDIFNGLVSLGFFVVVTWQCMVLAIGMRKTNEVSMSAFIPHFPFMWMIFFSCALLCLIMFSDLIKSVVSGVKK